MYFFVVDHSVGKLNQAQLTEQMETNWPLGKVFTDQKMATKYQHVRGSDGISTRLYWYGHSKNPYDLGPNKWFLEDHQFGEFELVK